MTEKIEGFFVRKDEMAEEIRIVEEMFINWQRETLKAFRERNTKRLSLLIYDEFMKHFASMMISRAMVEGRCLKTDVEEFLTCVRLDLTGVMKRLGGEVS